MHNAVIIGSGPAGLTAAIYLGRANLDPVVVEGMMAGGTPPGGQLMNTTDVENYPGFPEGITGPELMEKMKAQAERFGTKFVMGDVTSVEQAGDGRTFKVTVDEDETLEAMTVIVATGATARSLGLENELRLAGRGVSGCAVCDGAFFRDQEVFVVGGGDTAMEDSLYLTRMCKSVTVIHRRDELRASKIMGDRAKANEKISFLWDSELADVLGGETVTGIKVRNVKTGEETDHPCEGLFIAIGHTPNGKIVEGLVDLDEAGYAVPAGPGSRTKTPGLFVAGDVKDKVYRQAITAAGSGCIAALEAERYLEAMDDE